MPPCIRLFLSVRRDFDRSDVDLVWGVFILDAFWGARSKKSSGKNSDYDNNFESFHNSKFL